MVGMISPYHCESKFSGNLAEEEGEGERNLIDMNGFLFPFLLVG